MSAKSTPHRFRPRFLGVAFLSLSFGVVLVVASFILTPDKLSSLFALVCGLAGMFLGFAYLRSPVWRLALEVTEADLILYNGETERLRLPFSSVKEVLVDEERNTCFVDGGQPDSSVLIPGPGAPASYDVKKKRELIESILSRVPANKIREQSEECFRNQES